MINFISKFKTIVDNNKFRVIEEYIVNSDNSTDLVVIFNKVYKIQFKVLFFWITIKEFEEHVYDEDADFCKNEALEVYEYLIK